MAPEKSHARARACTSFFISENLGRANCGTFFLRHSGGIPLAFRGRVERANSSNRTGRSFGGVQRAAEITRAVLRVAFLTAERRSSD